MNAKRSVFLILISILVAAAGLVLPSCAAGEKTDPLTYEDTVVGRYADGMKIVSSFAAPKEATEFRDAPRVKKVLYLDTSVTGYHLTGLYLPAGEIVTVRLSPAAAQKGYKLVVNAHRPEEEVFSLDSISVGVTSASGGAADILIDRPSAGADTCEMTVQGGVETSYYRLGIDAAPVAGEGDLWILDAHHVRFTVTSAEISDFDLLEDTLRWWQTAAEKMDAVNGRAADKRIFVYTAEAESYSPLTGAAALTSTAIRELLDYDALIAGSAMPLLDEMAKIKTEGAEVFAPVSDYFPAVLSALVYAQMTADADESREGAWMTDAAETLIRTAAGGLSERQKARALFLNLLYGFGADRTTELFRSLSDELARESDWQQFNAAAAEILDADLSDYLRFVDPAIECDSNGRESFVPVQTSLTCGAEYLGSGAIRLPMGEAATFDFGAAAVAAWSTWRVSSVEGEGWTKISDTEYVYTPSAGRLSADFSVLLTDGAREKRLAGKVLTDIAVAGYRKYRDVPFRDVDSGVSQVKTMTADITGSTSAAGVPEETENAAEADGYTFSVGFGSFQVPKTGVYTLYLKSSGLCRVDFGVPAYMFTMFTNSLTVPDYTEELKYEATLDAGKIYRFDVYLLDISGRGRVSLGIRPEDGELTDLDGRYLVYDGLERADMPASYRPFRAVESFGIQPREYVSRNLGKWTVAADTAPAGNHTADKIADGNPATGFQSKAAKNKFVFDVRMNGSHYAQYMRLSVSAATVGRRCSITVSSDDRNYVPYAELTLEEENLLEKAENCKFVRIVIEDDEEFVCGVREFDLGSVLPQAEIVPDTSAQLHFLGEWRRDPTYGGVNGSVTYNADDKSVLTFSFYGDYFALYGVRAQQFGKAKIAVNNQTKGIVDFYAPETVCGARVFELSLGKEDFYTVKITPEKGDTVNVDYLTLRTAQSPGEKTNHFNLWYIAIIPGLALTGLIGFAIADVVSKKNKEKKKSLSRGTQNTAQE